MGMSKTEINLRRLLESMPNQSNQAKLAQYVVTLREQLAILTGETGHGNLPCISEKKAMEYAKQIESAASRVDTNQLSIWDRLPSKDEARDISESPINELGMGSKEDSPTTAGLRKRNIHGNSSKQPTIDSKSSRTEQGKQQRFDGQSSGSALKLDPATLELIEKHRHLQDELTEEMVGLARQMKEASLAMNQAVQDSDKVLDSTERGIEHSLAATKQANVRSQGVFSQGFKTGCLTWLVIFVMFSMFLLMVFFIRIT